MNKEDDVRMDWVPSDNPGLSLSEQYPDEFDQEEPDEYAIAVYEREACEAMADSVRNNPMSWEEREIDEEVLELDARRIHGLELEND